MAVGDRDDGEDDDDTEDAQPGEEQIDGERLLEGRRLVDLRLLDEALADPCVLDEHHGEHRDQHCAPETELARSQQRRDDQLLDQGEHRHTEYEDRVDDRPASGVTTQPASRPGYALRPARSVVRSAGRLVRWLGVHGVKLATRTSPTVSCHTVSTVQVPWRPANSHVGSRSWAFAVNTVAASALLSRPARCGIYRRFGIRLETNDVYPSCYFHTADISIGPGAIVNHGVYVDNAAHVEIGANVGIATGVKLLTSAHSIGPSGQRHAAWKRLPIDIHDGCWIGAGAIVLAGVTVGQG